MATLYEYPSIRQAYEQVKDNLNYQAQNSDVLDTKTSILWATATTVLGIVLSIGLSQITDKSISLSGDRLAYLWLSVAVYVVITLLTMVSMLPKRIGGFTDPERMRELAKLSENDFYHDMLTHIGEQQLKNNRALTIKAIVVKGLFILLLAEFGFLSWWGNLTFNLV